ncbi:hypothetical protein BGZ63DRAFT_401360 [Mariannaea sp. PMI_226]|nr:hypothetical protein BGZ63DRAFT_401360 [Mariannaea sp. PMI_226]
MPNHAAFPTDLFCSSIPTSSFHSKLPQPSFAVIPINKIMFLRFSTLACIGLIARASAAPTTSDSGLKIIDSYETDDAAITFWGLGTEGPSESFNEERDVLAPRDYSITCSWSHQANENMCKAVIAAVGNEKGGDQILKNPRAVCAQGKGQLDNDGECCISWDRKIWTGYYRDLVDGAFSIKNYCGPKTNGKISGYISAIKIGDTWAKMCVSDRADGC